MSHAPRPPTSGHLPSKSYFDLLKEKYPEPEAPAVEPALPLTEPVVTPTVGPPPVQTGLDLGSKSLLAVTLMLLLTTAGLTLTLKPSIPRLPLLTAAPAEASIAELRASDHAPEKPDGFESPRISAPASLELPAVPERAATAEPGRASSRPTEAEVETPARVSERVEPEAATRPALAESPAEVGRTAARDGRSIAEPRAAEPPGRTAFAPPPHLESTRRDGIESARRDGIERAVRVDALDQPLEPPGRLVSPLPGYTSAAWVAGVQGDVLLRASIDERGTVTGVEVVQGLPHGLTEAAVAAVRRWRFRPATRAGEPVAVDHNLSIRFAL